MGDLVNLNRFRKGRRRQEAEKQAAENRVRFGLTKAAKEKLRGESEKAGTTLDGKRLGED